MKRLTSEYGIRRYEERKSKILSILESGKELNINDIMKQLEVTRPIAINFCNSLREDGLIDMEMRKKKLHIIREFIIKLKK